MIKYTILLYFFCCITFDVWAQESSLHGVVLDAQTQEILPHVSITLEGSNIGTSTNTEGKFVFYIPSYLQEQNLLVMLMGYKPYRVKVNQIINKQDIRILLESTSENLSEVTLKALSAKEIVKIAYEKITENYPLSNTLYTGFYRESNYHYQNSIKDEKCYYIIEAIIKHNKPSYKHKLPIGDVKIIEARKNKFVTDTFNFSKWNHSLAVTTESDIVKERVDFITPTYLDRYKYQITNFTTYFGKQVYEISFTPIKENADYIGTIFIDSESYAIVKANYKMAQRNIKLSNILSPAINAEYLFCINYQPLGNKWYMQSVWEQVRARDKASNDSVRLRTEYVVTNIDTNKHEKFDYLDKIASDDIILLKSLPYRAEFWKNYSITPITKEEILIDVQIKTEEIATINTRTKKSKGFGYLATWISVNPCLVHNTASRLMFRYSTLSLSEIITFPPTSLAFGIGIGQEYHVFKGFYVTYQSTLGVGTFKNEGLQVGVKKEWKISNPKKRPLYIVGAVRYATLSLQKKIKDINNPENARITVLNNTFESDKVSLSIGNRQKGIDFSIGLDWELSRKLFLFFQVSYFAPITRQEGLYFKEKGFYIFRKPTSTWVDIQDSNLTIQSNSVNNNHFIFQSNILANTGFRISFGK